MSIDAQPFGTTESGEPVQIFSLNNAGLRAQVINYGGRLVSLHVPDRHGQPADIVLGFSSMAQYLQPHPFFGALIGRCANRIANATIQIDSQVYALDQNHQRHHIHGGFRGFDKVVWQAGFDPRHDADRLTLIYDSPDGEGGYPGKLHTQVSYSLTQDHSLRIDYSAISDQDTLVNLTNHSYFNLAGEGKGSIANHVLRIDAEHVTEVDRELIPTGRLLSVSGTRFDFRQFQPVAARPDCDSDGSIHTGYDHNWVLRRTQPGLQTVLSLYDPESGRVLDLSTTLPGVQVNTGNKIGLASTLTGKSGANYRPFGGIALETQFFPDAIHHTHFPSPILRKGQMYQHTTLFHFYTQ